MIRFASALVSTVMLGSGVVHGQSDRPPDDREVLAGPTVAPARAPSLVERDFTGRVKRLDLPPEEAALAHLDLDPAAREATTRILNERAAIMDRIVRDNIDLLLRFVTARQGGDRAAILSLLAEFNAKLGPLHARGDLVDELHDALPPATRGAFTSLVADYRRAIADEAAADAKAKGERARPRAIAARERLADLGLEVKRSYERQIGAGQKELDELIAELHLSSEQEAFVRNLVAEHVQKTKGKPTPAQQRQLVVSIMARLKPEQQRIVIERLLARTGTEPKPPASRAPAR